MINLFAGAACGERSVELRRCLAVEPGAQNRVPVNNLGLDAPLTEGTLRLLLAVAAIRPVRERLGVEHPILLGAVLLALGELPAGVAALRAHNWSIPAAYASEIDDVRETVTPQFTQRNTGTAAGAAVKHQHTVRRLILQPRRDPIIRNVDSRRDMAGSVFPSSAHVDQKVRLLTSMYQFGQPLGCTVALQCKRAVFIRRGSGSGYSSEPHNS